MNIFWHVVMTLFTLTNFIQQPLTQAYHIVARSSIPATSTPSGLLISVAGQNKKLAPVKVVNDSLGVAVTSQAAVVVDTASEAILWEKNKDEQRSIGSITKLMTAIVFLQSKPDLQTTIEVIAADQAPESKKTFEVGEKVILQDVLASALIASDNNAALMLARASGMSAADFVKKMNQQAAALGLSHSHFADPTGLQAANQSTAMEVASLAQAAFAQPEIRKLVSLSSYDFSSVSGQAHHLRSTNKIAKGFLQVTAAKTGYIDKAGHCLVAEVQQGNHRIITVSLGSATENDRFQDVKMLSYWIWHNYHWPTS
jgi:D-alanyl-D-alanine endopeptidase (penicillin-binding protein 7)